MKKARNLLAKVGIENDEIIRIETVVPIADVRKNERTGLGYYIGDNKIKVKGVSRLVCGGWGESSVEDLTALSFGLLNENLKKYDELVPRTLSFLPVARACQASCWFCFSESSLSSERERQSIDFDLLDRTCKLSMESGAIRFVVTGGGEPGLLAFCDLENIVRIGRGYFDKVVLITNGMFLSKKPMEDVVVKMDRLIKAGLSVICISCHSHEIEKTARLWGWIVESHLC